MLEPHRSKDEPLLLTIFVVVTIVSILEWLLLSENTAWLGLSLVWAGLAGASGVLLLHGIKQEHFVVPSYLLVSMFVSSVYMVIRMVAFIVS